MGTAMEKNRIQKNESAKEVAPGIFMLAFADVNAFLVQNEAAKDEWVLIDTGFENAARFIIKSVEKHFGKDSRPQAIILTHGHCDHAGAAEKLAELWDVPVYAHPLEIPYITGKKKYPANDTVNGEGKPAGSNSVDLGHRAVALTLGSGLPGMPGWKWIHTPGLTEGHLSFFRERDRVLIVGDAFSTLKQTRTQQNSLLEYTSADWKRAEDSLKYLLQLQPLLALPSHGQPMKGEELQAHMDQLVSRFDERAVSRGQFAD